MKNKEKLGGCPFEPSDLDLENAAGWDIKSSVSKLPGIRHYDWPGMVATSVPPLHAPSGSWLFDYDYDEVGGVMTHLWKAEDAFNGIDGYCKFCKKI